MPIYCTCCALEPFSALNDATAAKLMGRLSLTHIFVYVCVCVRVYVTVSASVSNLCLTLFYKWLPFSQKKTKTKK